MLFWINNWLNPKRSTGLAMRLDTKAGKPPLIQSKQVFSPFYFLFVSSICVNFLHVSIKVN